MEVAFAVDWFSHVLLRLVLALYYLVSSAVDDSTVPQIFNVASVRLAIVTVFLGDRVL